VGGNIVVWITTDREWETQGKALGGLPDGGTDHVENSKTMKEEKERGWARRCQPSEERRRPAWRKASSVSQKEKDNRVGKNAVTGQSDYRAANKAITAGFERKRYRRQTSPKAVL